MIACISSAPLAFVQLMITNARLDTRKRCLLAIANNYGRTALYYAVWCHSDPAVLENLIGEYPQALDTTDYNSNPPLHIAISKNLPADIRDLLVDTTAALASRD